MPEAVIEGTKFGLGKVLVTAQVALSLLLVVGAGLMLSTFWKLISMDAGFERDHVLLVSVDLRDGNYPIERWSAVYQEMLDQLRTITGVRSASVSSLTPVCHCRWAGEVVIEGYTPKSRADAMASFNDVSDRYFETLGPLSWRGAISISTTRPLHQEWPSSVNPWPKNTSPRLIR